LEEGQEEDGGGCRVQSLWGGGEVLCLLDCLPFPIRCLIEMLCVRLEEGYWFQSERAPKQNAFLPQGLVKRDAIGLCGNETDGLLDNRRMRRGR